MSGLPKFDDITAYGTPESEETRLWEKEVARLVQIANSPEAISFTELRTGSVRPTGTDTPSSTRLPSSSRMRLIYASTTMSCCSWSICRSRQIGSNDSSAKQRLLRDYDPDTAKEKFQRHLRLGKGQ